MSDKLKVTSAPQMFDLCAVDLFQVRSNNTAAIFALQIEHREQ
jgi:hypothetical protein